MTIIRYFTRRDLRTKLPGHLVAPHHIQETTLQQRLVMRAARARDPRKADALVNEIGFVQATTPNGLPSVDMRARLWSAWLRALGNEQHDPWRRHHRAYKRALMTTPRVDITMRYRD